MIGATGILFVLLIYPPYNWTYKIVLSGGPGVGKSAIIKQLESLQCKVKPEGFATLWQEAKKANLLGELFNDHTRLQHKLIARQLEFEAYATHSADVFFFDRGMVDILAFSKIFGHKIEQGDLALARKVDYDIVFIIEPLPQEYYRQTETRRETYQQSLEIHQKIVACYQQYCFDMGKNPEQFIVYVQAPTKINMSEEEIRQSISQRAEFILKTVFSTSR